MKRVLTVCIFTAMVAAISFPAYSQSQQINLAQEEAYQTAGHGTGCEIITFSQYEGNAGGSSGGTLMGTHMGYDDTVTGGVVAGGGGHTDTCVNLTIRNNESVERDISDTNIVAVTEKGDRRNPMGFTAKIKPGGTYQSTICFGKPLSKITKLECKF